MGFSIDFKNFDKFVKSMNTMERDFNNFLQKFLIQMANRVIAKTKSKQAGHEGEEFKAYDTGAMTNAWQLGNISGSGKNLEVEILNPMEYATDIEYGHRIVRGNTEVGYYNGRFMLKTSIDEIKAQMPARYDEEFKKFCEKRGLNAD